MDYHQDMDSEKFELFLHETCKRLVEKYDKIALVMDNASYHTTMRDDVPRRSGWTLAKYIKYCADNNLTVIATHSQSKRGGPRKLVLDDYKESALNHAETLGLKYKADTIMAQYGIRCVRLPPYHPELNPIERV